MGKGERSDNGGAEPLVLFMHKNAGPAYLLCSRRQFRIKAAEPADVLPDMQNGTVLSDTRLVSIDPHLID